MKALRGVALTGAAMMLAACGGTAGGGSTPDVVDEPETYALTVDVVDVTPLDLATNVDDEKCRPSALFSNADDARTPEFVVEDAGGAIVATGEISIEGTWSGDSCTMITELGEVPASDFYTLRLAGDDGLFDVKPFELEKTIEADPVDGALDVEWVL